MVTTPKDWMGKRNAHRTLSTRATDREILFDERRKQPRESKTSSTNDQRADSDIAQSPDVSRYAISLSRSASETTLSILHNMERFCNFLCGSISTFKYVANVPKVGNAATPAAMDWKSSRWGGLGSIEMFPGSSHSHAVSRVHFFPPFCFSASLQFSSMP